VAAAGYEQAEESGSPLALGFMATARGLLHACRGRVDAALRDAARAAELARSLGLPLLTAIAAQAIGIATLPTGDAQGTHDRLGPLVADLSGSGLAEPAVCRFIPDEVEALIRLGDLSEAEALLGPFQRRSAQLRRSWGTAAALRCRGLLRAARGDLRGADYALEAALAIHQQLTMPFERARTLLIAGEAQRRARHKSRAARALQDAQAIFDELGAPLWAARARDERRRVGIRAAGARAGSDLTAAESRVASLVAAGHTTAEVAALLFMGQRTVEAHLSRVYRKLGVRSRTELAGHLRTAPWRARSG
jgi:DNA-binding CsgD family transcriptional regulator